MAKLQPSTVNHEYKWYAIYTRLNHEKAVEQSLIENNIETYLPKRKVLKTWSDRKKWVEEPLFRPYIFVRVSNKEYYRVLQIPSILNYICFGGTPAVIGDNQIELVKRLIKECVEIDVVDFNPNKGSKVEIKGGLLDGYYGEIINFKGLKRLLVRLENLQYSIIINLDKEYLYNLIIHF